MPQKQNVGGQLHIPLNIKPQTQGKWSYLPAPSTEAQAVAWLFQMLIMEKIRNPKMGPYLPFLGAFSVLTSAMALTEFCLTRKFVAEGKANIFNIAKFTTATAWLGYWNWRYFSS